MTMMYTVILAISVIMIGALAGMAFTLSVYLADKTETKRAERVGRSDEQDEGVLK